MAITGEGIKQIWKSEITANDATAQETLGARRIVKDGTLGEQEYCYVKFDSAITAGKGCVWSSTSTSNPYSVAIATSGPSKQKCAGIAVATITASYYGWLLVRGVYDGIKNHSKHCSSNLKEMILWCYGFANYLSHLTTSGKSVPILAGITAFSKCKSNCAILGYVHTM